jgi:FkbM family methyltransferase
MTTTDLLGVTIQIVDSKTFLSGYKNIFEDEIYSFDTNRKRPRIIDGGANIGLATLYWKKKFPNARITCFEPDPDIFEVLNRNIKQHVTSGVELVQKGLWKEEAVLKFKQDGKDGGHFSEFPADHEVAEEEVPVTRLVDYLHEPVDMLKLDIEGAEMEVLLDSSNHLDNVDNLFVEYHSYPGREQRLDELFSLLRESGFRVHLKPGVSRDRPFIDNNVRNGIENTVNIFSYKNEI